jgi:predicted GNAT family acetyltransferase
MALTEETFMPNDNGSAVKLTESDILELKDLYEKREEPFFLPYMLTSGTYYGIRKDGKLVSAAGTHVTSSTNKIACMGTVFTHPAYRGKGYATICVSKVVEELLLSHKDIILNVDSKNFSAIRIYEKLGFREHCTFFEATATAKKAEKGLKSFSSD